MNDPTAAKVRTSNENGQMFFSACKATRFISWRRPRQRRGTIVYPLSLSIFCCLGKGRLTACPKLPDGVEDTLQYQDTVSNGAKMCFDALNSPQDLESNRFRFYKTDKDGNGLKGAVFTLTAIQKQYSD